jgi:hypothetical protein
LKRLRGREGEEERGRKGEGVEKEEEQAIKVHKVE